MTDEFDTLLTANLTEREVYKLLTGMVVPRPIAWVTTLNEDGSVNLAPFSAFVILSNEPPTIGISIGRRGADVKDTVRNLKRTGEFVVNAPHRSHAELVHLSAQEFSQFISETAELGLQTLPSSLIDTPRLSIASTAMECVFEEAHEFGTAKTELIVGTVRAMHVRRGLLSNGKIDTRELDPLGRVVGPSYASLGDVSTYRALQHTLYSERGEG